MVKNSSTSTDGGWCKTTSKACDDVAQHYPWAGGGLGGVFFSLLVRGRSVFVFLRFGETCARGVDKRRPSLAVRPLMITARS